jgi:tetrahydromethanopterin S-methyltransferase subunit E
MGFEALAVILAVLSLIVALGTIIGWFEDLESDAGSQSNPNSQVQLAPQVGVLHRIYNKAISGEPVSWGLIGVTSGMLFSILWYGFHLHPLIAVVASCAFTMFVHLSLAVSAFLGRTSGVKVFGQPLFLDVAAVNLPLIAAHGFIGSTALVALSYIFYVSFFRFEGLLGYPVPIPILGFLLGVMAGAIGSSTGDVHYGAERQFQQYPFGEGVPSKNFGHITIKAEAGWRTSADITYFCAKYGGPMAGLCYGLILLLDNLRLLAGNFTTSLVGLAFGGLIIAGLFATNRYLEKNARKKFGAYA